MLVQALGLQNTQKPAAEAKEPLSCLTGKDSLEANVPNFLSLIASHLSWRTIIIIAAARGSRCRAEPLHVLISRAEPGIMIPNLQMGIGVLSLNSLPTAQSTRSVRLYHGQRDLDLTQKTAAIRPHLPQCPGLIRISATDLSIYPAGEWAPQWFGSCVINPGRSCRSLGFPLFLYIMDLRMASFHLYHEGRQCLVANVQGPFAFC